ncbi:MAG: ribose 5-phosphate isomerase B [Acidobacteria bacterium]|nr:ribose 5-phosphate isomerase B [Acidobacteriota bacterium]
MRVVLGSDHAGFAMKQKMLVRVQELGHQVLDVGTHNNEPSDYPDYAEALGTALLKNQADRGILICGSGVGASVAVNKIPGIRAGVCHDCYSAHQGVEHDNMNVLVMGARIIGQELAYDIVAVYLDAQFSCEERHLRRLAKLQKLENKFRQHSGR